MTNQHEIQQQPGQDNIDEDDPQPEPSIQPSQDVLHTQSSLPPLSI